MDVDARESNYIKLMAARQEVVYSLRNMAYVLENNPMTVVPTPNIYAATCYMMDQNGELVNYGREVTVNDVRQIMSLMPGGWSKTVDDRGAIYKKRLGGRLEWTFIVNRPSTCRRVIVGSRTILATEEHEEPIYEWRCDEEA